MTFGVFDPTLRTNPVRASGVYATPSVQGERERGPCSDARSSAKPAVGGLLRQVVASMTAVLWMLWLDLDR
jgi:hypothetical protein